MYYKKLTDGTLEIEFANDWLGNERISVNGQLVSKKYSVWGIEHQFSAVEGGEKHYYTLTTKVNQAMEVFIDIAKDGVLIHDNVNVTRGSKPSAPKNTYKAKGIALVREFYLDDGVISLIEALNYNPSDPEIFFYLACAYSVLENSEEGFSCLIKAVQNNMQNQEIIKTHEMLSFLRMHTAYDEFVKSGYTIVEL